MLSVQSDTKKLTSYLKGVQRKQIPFATKNALNDVAFDARSFVKKSLPRRFDRPTQGLISSVQVKKTNKKDLTAIVGFAGLGFRTTKWTESPAKIMRRHIKGGTRFPKMGGKLRIPSDTKGGGIKLNMFGNIAGKKNKIAKMIGKSDQFFEGVPKGNFSNKDRGIWERTPANNKRAKGSKAKKWKATGKIVQRIAYEPFTKYKARYPFEKIVVLAVNKNYKKRFERALKEALKTAK
jgi:hypothetical protein